MEFNDSFSFGGCGFIQMGFQIKFSLKRRNKKKSTIYSFHQYDPSSIDPSAVTNKRRARLLLFRKQTVKKTFEILKKVEAETFGLKTDSWKKKIYNILTNFQFYRLFTRSVWANPSENWMDVKQSLNKSWRNYLHLNVYCWRPSIESRPRRGPAKK